MSINISYYVALLVVTVGASFATTAAEARGKESRTPEQQVLDAAFAGTDKADSSTIADLENRKIRSSFLEDLLTDTDKKKKLNRRGFTIKNAIFDEPLNLSGVDVPVAVLLVHCTFNKEVKFSSAHFHFLLDLTESEFTDAKAMLNFNGLMVDDLFNINKIKAAGDAQFFRMKIGGDLFASEATFSNPNSSIQFGETRVKGKMFLGPNKIDGQEYGPSEFDGALSLADVKTLGLKLSCVIVKGDLDLGHATIQTVLGVPGQCPETMSAASAQRRSLPNSVILEGLTYKDLEGGVGPGLLGLIDRSKDYSERSYTQLESYYRTHADPDAADEVFLHMKDRERKQLFCQITHPKRKRSLFNPFSWLPWLWSWVLRILVGYGRRPEYALYYSFGVVIIGAFIFRHRTCVVPRRPDDQPQNYNPFWYSFDLLTPFIDLHQADTWMPRQDWRFGRNYAHLHRILGWILVPIGIAAITGIIK